jgi:hypothetical protein
MLPGTRPTVGTGPNITGDPRSCNRRWDNFDTATTGTSVPGVSGFFLRTNRGKVFAVPAPKGYNFTRLISIHNDR